MNRVISMKSSLFPLSLGLLVSRSVNAARRTRASFERSSLYTCDLDSAPCLTMMVSRGDLIAQSSHQGGRLSHYGVESLICRHTPAAFATVAGAICDVLKRRSVGTSGQCAMSTGNSALLR